MEVFLKIIIVPKERVEHSHFWNQSLCNASKRNQALVELEGIREASRMNILLRIEIWVSKEAPIIFNSQTIIIKFQQQRCNLKQNLHNIKFSKRVNQPLHKASNINSSYNNNSQINSSKTSSSLTEQTILLI
jgi:hypothetical protein